MATKKKTENSEISKSLKEHDQIEKDLNIEIEQDRLIKAAFEENEPQGKYVIREELLPGQWVPFFESTSAEMANDYFNSVKCEKSIRLDYEFEENCETKEFKLREKKTKLPEKKTQPNQPPEAPNILTLLKLIVANDREISLKISRLFVNSIDKAYKEILKDKYQLTFSRISKLHLLSGHPELFEEITFSELFNIMLVTEKEETVPVNQLPIQF